MEFRNACKHQHIFNLIQLYIQARYLNSSKLKDKNKNEILLEAS
jgi:hypothetical protein